MTNFSSMVNGQDMSQKPPRSPDPTTVKLMRKFLQKESCQLPKSDSEIRSYLRDTDSETPWYGVWNRVFCFVFKEDPNDTWVNGRKEQRDERWDELFVTMSAAPSLEVVLRECYS
jgi:hypothetical protein